MRERVPMRDAGADQLVVVMKPGNAGGAKGLNRPAKSEGQPISGGAEDKVRVVSGFRAVYGWTVRAV